MNEDTQEGVKAFQEVGKKLKAEVEAKKQTEAEKKETALVELNALRSMAGVGMSHVDKSDIRPPQILLVQKSSNLDEMIDLKGSKPSFGQFFDTGARTIVDQFDCYVVFAKKSTWINRRKPEMGPQDQYSMIGVMKGTKRVFGMLLRSSARYSLNNLFSTAIDQQFPMFAFNVHVETKKLSNQDGEWVTPVFRVGQLETDAETLAYLMKIARKFDSQADSFDLDAEVQEIREVDQSIQDRNQETTEVEDVSEKIPF